MVPRVARLSLAFGIVLAMLSPSTPVQAAAETPQPLPEARYEQRPVTFEMNRGQAPAGIQVLGRSPGATVFLKPDEATIVVSGPAGARARLREHRATRESQSDIVRSAVRMTLLGANPAAQLQTSEAVAARTNYLRGSNAEHWLSDVPTFSSVE